MPEGDTIFRTARTLQRALAGRTVTGFESPLPALRRVDEDEPIAGRACRRCGTPIASRKQGESARLTYWCPRCQT